MHDELRIAYQQQGLPTVYLGGIELNGQVLPEGDVNFVLKSLNRHGLIAGATGSGKTKTIQLLCEQLSKAGVPSLVMDIKGDISGLAMPGEVTDFIANRCQQLAIDYRPQAYPVELFTLSEKIKGIPLRSTVLDFGAILFARMLDLNETQTSVVTVVFEYAKENGLAIIDLADFKALLNHLQSEEGKRDLEARFGSISSSTVSIILRKLIELQAQGANEFFADPAFKVNDLLRTTHDGQGIISILRLMDMQDKPKLFSTFMLKLLSDVYNQFPEIGDPIKPKLMLFIDEAHLIFSQASKALLELLETIVKLIRSKGVGIVFCTQSPNDIPETILAQLGLKIQHVLRAFTAKERQALRLVAKNFPPSDHYDTEHLLTSLGIGEALVSALDAKGQPAPLIQCLIAPPTSRMGVLTDYEANSLVKESSLYAYYGKKVNRHSAVEQLAQKRPVKTGESKKAKANSIKKEKRQPSLATQLSKNTLVRQLARQAFRQVLNRIFDFMGWKKK